MAEVIIMPKLGFNMDEGRLVKWCANVGDTVKKGDVLFEIETDKTTMPVEATGDGVLLKTMLEEGGYAPVFTPIAVVGAQGEDVEAAIAAAEGGQEAAPAADVAPGSAEVPLAVAAPAAATANTAGLKLTPKAKKLVADEGIDPASLASVAGTGYQGGITARDIKASPLAKKLAARSGVDLAAVSGSGAGGKVMKADVAAAAAAPAVKAGATAGSAAPAGSTDEKKVLQTVPYKGVRKIIGERLAQSKFTAPHLYFTDSIDTTKFTAFRKQLNESSEVKIAVSDLLTLTASKCLQKFPGINVSLVGEEIVYYQSTNVGTAVAGENVLVVPVVKNAQDKTLTQIATESRDLVERAKVGKLAQEEYSGGTFTISNLGMFGIENFTAIINPPESAILAVSSVRKTPVVIEHEGGEDEIAIRPMMNIQLTVDHRLIDGLLAAQFVAHFKALLEDPIRILM